MIGASKILTVSYGTFSCTLEGFDDPFNTMRAIAEYFRDLAAEDRYFGAEPPTPDAAMLHKIAEREIHRRVEAKIDANGVILRAADPESAVVSHPVPERTLPRLAEPALAAAETDATDSVVARLSRLRDAQIEAAPLADAPTVDTYNEDEHAETAVAAIEEDQAELTAEDTTASVMTGLREAITVPDSAAEVELKSEVADVEEPTEDIFAMTEAMPEDVGEDAPEDLQEWQLSDAADDITVDLDDQETPDPAPSKSDDDIMAATLGAMIDPEGDDDFEEELVEDVAASVAEEEADLADLAPMPEYVEPQTQAPVEETAVVVETEAAVQPDAIADVDAQDRLQRARARVIKIRRIDTSATPVSPEVSLDPAPEPELTTNAPAASVSVLSPEAEAELQRELAALEAELAPAMAVDEVATDDPPLHLQTQDAPQSAEETAQSVEEAAPAESPDLVRLPEAAQSDDAVNRLISQTNSVMEGPENKRRLAAIAHLKAAVAATFADRKTNPGATQPGPAERMDPYRDDLDRVVRPRRPALVGSSTHAAGASSAHQTARPQIDTRPAPLVLVSEQRIDRPAAANAGPVSPVRPRRITTSMLEPDPMTGADGDEDFDEDSLSADDVNNIFSDPSQPFVDFAERLGASSMPEMLEAAAAYCAMYLGREQFTRPLLLQQIADLPDGEAISREDCLRGFGTLLRDGRIQKIKRGQFKLSDHSRYLAEAKRMAG